MQIRDIYHKNPITISPDTSVAQALKLTEKHDVNGFLVVKGKKVLGVLSLQDIAAATVPYQFQKNYRMAMSMYRKGFFAEQALAIKDKPVKEIMRLDFVTVDLKTNIMAIMTDFLKNDLYIVPVVEKGELLGIVTRSQIREALLTSMGLERAINDKN